MNPSDLRAAMSRFATGVIVLSVGGESIHGMTANAFSSVSLAPPSVLCSVAHSAVMHSAITAERRFGVSLLSAEHTELARYFADKRRPLGPAQFSEVDWEPGPLTGAPLIPGALAWLECELSDSLESGDHTVFIGDVLSARVGPEHDGLLFFEGAFRRVASSSASPAGA